MKKAVATAAVIALGALSAAAMPSPAAASDKDCADFPTQRAAQIFFLKHGGPRYDPDRLDGDDDGIACEDNRCPCYFKKHLPRPARSDADRLVLAVA
jgi:hypothetical protein